MTVVSLSSVTIFSHEAKFCSIRGDKPGAEGDHRAGSAFSSRAQSLRWVSKAQWWLAQAGWQVRSQSWRYKQFRHVRELAGSTHCCEIAHRPWQQYRTVQPPHRCWRKLQSCPSAPLSHLTPFSFSKKGRSLPHRSLLPDSILLVQVQCFIGLWYSNIAISANTFTRESN